VRGKIIKQARGTDYLLVAYAADDDQSQEDRLYGELFKFTQIDPESDWLDLDSGEAIEIDEGQEPPVPDNLKPNLKRIPFVFFLESHTLIFDRTNISPGLAAGTLFVILPNIWARH
jgi:hypothetical protein